jgi:nucleotide-binding universal stress UspA family protein
MVTEEFTTVVIGVDGSSGGASALQWGLALAERRQAPVRLVHAFAASSYDVGIGGGHDIGALADASRNLLEITLEQAQSGHATLTITSALVDDNAAAALIEQSREAATIVIGAHGARGFSNLVAGSTTMNVATHAHCTVVTVPTDLTHAHEGTGIVVGVDGSEISYGAIDYALREASETGQPVTALHAWVDPATMSVGAAMPMQEDPDGYARRQEQALAQMLAPWMQKHADVAVAPRVVHEHPVHALAAASQGAQLLVVGCRGSDAQRSMMLGSVSNGVLHLATCPVAVVHDHTHD